MSQYPDIITRFKLYETLKQKYVILIFRLHTDHYHLNQYLHQFNIIEILECECDMKKETVQHYLLNYELYDEKRDILRRIIEAQRMRSSILLRNRQIIKDIVDYIEKTDRFKLEQR